MATGVLVVAGALLLVALVLLSFRPVAPAIPEGPSSVVAPAAPRVEDLAEVEPEKTLSDTGGEADWPPAWSGIDLATVREALPDNRYWTELMPTQDPAELRRRQSVKEERNRLFGRIQTGRADVDEIHAHYDEREAISRDNVAFAEYLLQHHANDLSERDLGLVVLARNMNRDRLAQLPDERARALARRAEEVSAR